MVLGVEEGVGDTHSDDESPLDTIVMPGKSSKLVGDVREELLALLLDEALLVKIPFGTPPGAPFKSQPKSMVDEIKVPGPFPFEGLELELPLGGNSDGNID